MKRVVKAWVVQEHDGVDWAERPTHYVARLEARLEARLLRRHTYARVRVSQAYDGTRATKSKRPTGRKGSK